MKNTISLGIALSLLAALSVALTACQRQEEEMATPPTRAPIAEITTPPVTPAPKSVNSASIVDNPAVTDLLNTVVRSDLPGMTFEQVKSLFPAICIVNDDDRSISCPNVSGLVSISYAGGPDGILNMVFSGGMASCKTLKMQISSKFGKGEDISDQNNDGVCDVKWWEIDPKYKTHYANIGKLSGRDHVTLQIGAEQGP